MATGTKSALGSLTIRGAALAGIPALDALLVQLGLSDQPVITPVISSVTTLVGVFLAAWGRVRAVKQISRLF